MIPALLFLNTLSFGGLSFVAWRTPNPRYLRWGTTALCALNYISFIHTATNL